MKLNTSCPPYNSFSLSSVQLAS